MESGGTVDGGGRPGPAYRDHLERRRARLRRRMLAGGVVTEEEIASLERLERLAPRDDPSDRRVDAPPPWRAIGVFLGIAILGVVLLGGLRPPAAGFSLEAEATGLAFSVRERQLLQGPDQPLVFSKLGAAGFGQFCRPLGEGCSSIGAPLSAWLESTLPHRPGSFTLEAPIVAPRHLVRFTAGSTAGAYRMELSCSGPLLAGTGGDAGCEEIVLRVNAEGPADLVVPDLALFEPLEAGPVPQVIELRVQGDDLLRLDLEPPGGADRTPAPVAGAGVGVVPPAPGARLREVTGHAQVATLSFHDVIEVETPEGRPLAVPVVRLDSGILRFDSVPERPRILHRGQDLDLHDLRATLSPLRLDPIRGVFQIQLRATRGTIPRRLRPSLLEILLESGLGRIVLGALISVLLMIFGFHRAAQVEMT